MAETTIVFLFLLGFLLLSVFLNILSAWYIRGLLMTLLFFSENLNDLLQILDDFNKHIKSVYELETFYGDEVLQSLLHHGGKVMQQLEEFEEIINFSEDEEEDEEEDEDELEGSEMNEQKDEPDPTKDRGNAPENIFSSQTKIKF